MGENTIIEQTRIIERRKIRSNLRYIFFHTFRGNRIMEQQGTVNNRAFVLLNFRSIILALTI